MMQAHHIAWLSVHPERTEDWLSQRLSDGFDVHHLDGDHANNDPLNLVLIECGDHLMLHNGKTRLTRLNPKKGPRGPQKITLHKRKMEAAKPVKTLSEHELRALRYSPFPNPWPMVA
jgi:hypothetical protein